VKILLQDDYHCKLATHGGLLAITKERPAWRSTVTGQYKHGAWNGMARYSYYGKYTSSLYSYSGSDVQNYRGKGLVDTELGFALMQGFKLSVGARNIFDVYPDGMNEGNGFDIFPWPPASAVRIQRTLPVHSRGADWEMSGLREGRLCPGNPLTHSHICPLYCGARAGSPY